MTKMHAGLSVLILGLMAATAAATRADLPKVGDAAKDFELTSVEGKPIQLKNLTAKGPVVLVVLRGNPGYQCPLCTRQVGELVSKAKAFEQAGATVLMVYPGPAKDLQAKAKEFLGGKGLPSPFVLVTDPNYGFTSQYGLRWDADSETAYPSTFVINTQGTIAFATISKEHGGRVGSKTVLDALSKLK